MSLSPEIPSRRFVSRLDDTTCRPDTSLSPPSPTLRERYYVRSASGDAIPLSALVTTRLDADPLVVLVTVPMSLCGALIFLTLDFATLSLFGQVGLITLVALISKHGILIVDFARWLQERGVAFEEAIIEAAAVRLRPILMTTAAIVMAVIPLLIASGPGAVSRYHIGLVIVTGMGIGTLFTLFILPVVYTYIAERRQGMLPNAQENPKFQASE
jgi:hypothetical protein